MYRLEWRERMAPTARRASGGRGCRKALRGLCAFALEIALKAWALMAVALLCAVTFEAPPRLAGAVAGDMRGWIWECLGDEHLLYCCGVVPSPS